MVRLIANNIRPRGFLWRSTGTVMTRIGNTAIRSYVAPINDLNFLIKDVYEFPKHYKQLGYDPEVDPPLEGDILSLVGVWRRFD